MNTSTTLTAAQWKQFDDLGYVKLGRVIDDASLKALQTRIDEIMLGTASVNYDRMLMQLDSSSGKYEDAGPQTKGHKGATLNYRKIQDLELDPLFLAYMQHPLFRHICEHVYGPGVPIASFRAMFFNKPSMRGTELPWHQDRWHGMDRDPLVTIWTALDPATKANGCVQIVPGLHKSVINPEHSSGFMTPEQWNKLCPPEKAFYVELEAGEVALLHNWAPHRSDVNRSQISRRAFSTCYMDARTVCRNGEKYPVIFGEGALKVNQAQTANAR